MAPDGARSFFPTNPDLADMLGRTDFDFDNFLSNVAYAPETATVPIHFLFQAILWNIFRIHFEILFETLRLQN